MALGCMRRTQIGAPYTLTQDARERACDRRADASSNDRPEQKSPPCVRCAPRLPRGRVRCAQTGQARSASRRPAFPAKGRSPFGAPRGIFGPGPCSAVVRPPTLEPRRACARHGRQRCRRGTARLKPLSKAPRGGAAVPPGSCGLRRTGHRYPEDQGLANLPGAAANRLRGHHSLRRRPSGARMRRI
jgi:hypothetical protein